MNIINCTPHPITWIKSNGEKEVFNPSGIVPRISSTIIPVDDMFVKNQLGEVEGLPLPKEDTYYIVSAMVFGACDREDVIAPNTAQAIRDEKGFIIGVPNFIVK